MMLDPGDVTVAQIEAVLFGLQEMRAMALEGYSEGEIALANGWRREDVRTGAALMGFSVSPMVTRQELCPVCGYLLMPDGHCEICSLHLRLERLHAVNAEEHRREVERLENEVDAIKQDTCRTREGNGTNPRKGARED
jgi:hypothetical protein